MGRPTGKRQSVRMALEIEVEAMDEYAGGPPKSGDETRFCDMVMKGGITSGVVYPLAITRLARAFRLRNIGGTSAGAIAAAAAAAAEAGRHRGNSQAMQTLERLPAFLQHSGAGGKTNLFMFFAPQQATRRLFAVVTAPLGSSGLAGAVKVLWALLRHYALAALLGALPGAGLLWLALSGPPGPLATVTLTLGVLIALLGAVLFPTVWFVVSFLRRVPRNRFGLCSGMPAEGAQEVPATLTGGDALTIWLTGYLNQLAGLPPDGPPLTFGQLWRPDAAPGDTVAPPTDPSVQLEMLTTCLTWGRPFRLPFRDDDDVKENRFYIRRDDLQALFPGSVVRWIEAHPRPSRLAQAHLEAGFLPLPEPWNLPVVVATRLSLSFPVLLSAIPLYAYDQQATDAHCERFPPDRCWFSDGGICSNFPMHFFDSPLPRWPTFAINLVEVPEETDPKTLEDPRMPEDNRDGIQELWRPLEPSDGVFAFLSAILKTMQDWSDNAMARLPGYRDRIAHVHLTPDEGGLNLNMPEEVIERLVARGARGGSKFVKRFGEGDHPVMTWENHRWLRLRSTLASLEELLSRVNDGGRYEPPGGEPSYQEWLGSMPPNGEPSYEWVNLLQRDRARAALAELGDVIENWHKPSGEGTAPPPPSEKAPRPRPELRPRPRM